MSDDTLMRRIRASKRRGVLTHAETVLWALQRTRTTGACWEWLGARNSHDYGIIGPRQHSKQMLAHRFFYQAFVGPIPDGLFVCHHCDNPPCVNPAHLFVGTNKENSDDSFRKGRNVHATKPHLLVRGEKSNFSKLTEDAVRTARRRFKDGTPIDQIAKDAGVTLRTIRRVVDGETWAWVGEQQ